jgi:hypothetical protein
MNMKRFFNALFVFGAFAFVMAISRMAVADCLTGSFYNPEKNGEGFSIESLPGDKLLAYFYTYKFMDEEFLVLIGEKKDNEFKMSVFDTKMTSLSPFLVEEIDAGSATFNFIDRDNFEYSIELELDIDKFDGSGIPWCIGSAEYECGWSGKVQRLTDSC